MKYLAIVFLALALSSPASSQESFTHDLTWAKPEIYITPREPCLEYALRKRLIMHSAELLEDLGKKIRVRCHLMRRP